MSQKLPFPCVASRLQLSLSVTELLSAKTQVIKLTQHHYMNAEVDRLIKKNVCGAELPRSSSIVKLSPFMDHEGLIQVGGRLKNSSEGMKNKHPVVIPRKSAASSLLIRKAHEEVAHCGRCSTLNKLREDGFWVIGAHSAVRSHIDK